MANTLDEWRTPDLRRTREIPVHPGQILLKEFLEPRGIPLSAAARHLGMPASRLNHLVGGRRRFTAETAVLVAALTGTSPQMWMSLQSNRDLWQALRSVDQDTLERLHEVARSNPAPAPSG